MTALEKSGGPLWVGYRPSPRGCPSACGNQALAAVNRPPPTSATLLKAADLKAGRRGEYHDCALLLHCDDRSLSTGRASHPVEPASVLCARARDS